MQFVSHNVFRASCASPRGIFSGAHTSFFLGGRPEFHSCRSATTGSTLDSAARGNIRREQGHARQYHQNGAERRRVARVNSIAKTRHQAGQDEGCHESSRGSSERVVTVGVVVLEHWSPSSLPVLQARATPYPPCAISFHAMRRNKTQKSSSPSHKGSKGCKMGGGGRHMGEAPPSTFLHSPSTG